MKFKNLRNLIICYLFVMICYITNITNFITNRNKYVTNCDKLDLDVVYALLRLRLSYMTITADDVTKISATRSEITRRFLQPM